jgi:hypothetical protein
MYEARDRLTLSQRSTDRGGGPRTGECRRGPPEQSRTASKGCLRIRSRSIHCLHDGRTGRIGETLHYALAVVKPFLTARFTPFEASARRPRLTGYLPHDRDGALADEHDRHRVGVDAWHATQRAAWEALVANSVAIAIKAARASAAAAGRSLFTR